MAFDGSHIWVANVHRQLGDGAERERRLLGAGRSPAAPTASTTRIGVAFDGSHIWVANHGGNSVTELNASDGSWVRTLSGGSYGFNRPYGVAFDGSHIWVTNIGGNSVTELNASDGSWVRTLSGGSYGFNDPYGVAFDGSHIWVTNYDGNSVTELPDH